MYSFVFGFFCSTLQELSMLLPVIVVCLFSLLYIIPLYKHTIIYCLFLVDISFFPFSLCLNFLGWWWWWLFFSFWLSQTVLLPAFFWCTDASYFFLNFLFFNFKKHFIYLLATSCGLQDLRSPTRDWTRAMAVKTQNPNH